MCIRSSFQAITLRNVRALLSIGLLCWAIPVNAEYRLDVGDVLEIAVAGVPELRQRVVVQMDGSISFPLLGTLPLAGLPQSEVRAKIRAILPTKVFRQRGPDGRENIIIIEADQVTATVVEYRPIYVNGDVSQPGEQIYRPRMTVHQAVAKSGGYDVMRFRMNHPLVESADLRSEYESLWTELVKQQAQVSRMRMELGEKGNFDQEALRNAPISPFTVSQIANVEAEHLKSRQDDYEREKVFLHGGIKQSDQHIEILSEQLRAEEQGLQSDSQDLQRLLDLFGKGAVPITRVTEARKAVLLSSIRKLQTTSYLITLGKQRDDFSRQLEKLDSHRRINLLRELQEASLKVSQIKAKLQSTWEKIQYMGIVRSQLVRGPGGKPDLVVIRKGENGRDRLVADEDFELQPGDVVEVTLRIEHPAEQQKASQITTPK